MLVAFFNPEPIAKSEDGGQSQGGKSRDRPRRREKKQVHQQDDRRDRMEVNVYEQSTRAEETTRSDNSLTCMERNRFLFRDHQGLVDLHPCTVKI